MFISFFASIPNGKTHIDRIICNRRGSDLLYRDGGGCGGRIVCRRRGELPWRVMGRLRLRQTRQIQGKSKFAIISQIY